MHKYRFAVFLLVPVVLVACAIGYQARGSLSDVPGELRGKGYPGSSGGGRFVLTDPQGRLTCDGQAQPPKASPTPGSSGRQVERAWCAAPMAGKSPCTGRRSPAAPGRAAASRTRRATGWSFASNGVDQRSPRSAQIAALSIAPYAGWNSCIIYVISLSWNRPYSQCFRQFRLLGKSNSLAQEIHEVIDHVSLFEEFSFPEFEALCDYMDCYTAPRHGVLIREGKFR